MKRLILCKVEEAKLSQILQTYSSFTPYDARLEIALYKKVLYEGYTTNKLAAEEHMSRSSIYRRIKKVDLFVKKMLDAEMQ